MTMTSEIAKIVGNDAIYILPLQVLHETLPHCYRYKRFLSLAREHILVHNMPGPVIIQRVTRFQTFDPLTSDPASGSPSCRAGWSYLNHFIPNWEALDGERLHVLAID